MEMDQMNKCPNCGHENDDKAWRCRGCGKMLYDDEIIDPNI